MSNPNDVRIDIPLTKVTSRSTTGRRNGSSSPTLTDSEPDFGETMTEKKSLHFHQGPGGRRRKLESQGMANRSKDDGSLNAMGKFYNALFHFSVITRYLLFVAPLALVIAAPIIVGATAAPDAEIAGVKIVWFFTWIEVVWLSLWVSKLFAKLIPHVFQFLCGVVSSGTRKYALVLIALEIPISLVGWAVASLATFLPIMTRNPDQRARGDTGTKDWERVVYNILWATVISTLIFLAEKLLIQIISISYHRKQFDERIKESKHNIHLIGLLYEASRRLFPAYCREFEEEDYLISDNFDIGSGRNSRKGHHRNASNAPLRLLQNVARVGDKVTAAFGNVAHEITGKQVFNPTSAHSVVVEALEKTSSSEALARRLWLSFVLEGKDALYREDIADVLGADRAEEAEEAFDCLDVDGNGDISLEEMIMRVTEFGRERFAIAHSMHDVDQAINVLDSLLIVIVLILVVFIYVAWLNSNFTTTLATTATALLSLSFVFATTAQEVLGSCIFLFVKHPFDVGDRVDITEVGYVVERISLLYTVFKRVKDHKRTQVPNIVLNSLWVDNVSRSKAMREQVLLYVDIGTPLEDINLLKDEMTKFVRDKDNSRDFQRDVDIEVTGLAEMNKMELKIEIRHKSNWANETVRAARRSKFMCALVLAMRKVPINGPAGGGPAAGDKANPTYSVSISDVEARSNKDAFDQNKEKNKLVNKIELGEEAGLTLTHTSSFSPTQEAAMQGLNRRNFAADATRDDTVSMERRTSTGRRRVGLSPTVARQSSVSTQNIPTLSSPLPRAHNASGSFVQRTSSLSSRPSNDFSVGSPAIELQGGPVPNIGSRLPPPTGLSMLPTIAQSPGPAIPGNAFAQQQFQQYQQQHQSPPPQLQPRDRKPVPPRPNAGSSPERL